MRYLAIAALFILCACSATGGARSRSGTVANISHLRIAMVTHQAPGDTFWDIVRHGAEAAAANDDVDLIYSNDPNASGQAVLIQNAIDQRVDGIAVTLPAPDALAAAVKRAQRAGIPVIAFNAGFDAWKRLGIPMYVGQDEEFAGRTAGQRLSAEGAKHVLCVVQFQGQVQLEARCKGLQEGLNGARSEKIYVNGADMPSVRSTITAKLQEDPSIDYVVDARRAYRTYRRAGGEIRRQQSAHRDVRYEQAARPHNPKRQRPVGHRSAAVPARI